MGVPKFYRWISERYPALSEVVKEYQIPEFDNLYLDMNGIIHVCSHPNDNDPHFRITEEKIFQDIFHYIEVLFRLIQPRQVFIMAVDGVAPRAKMNQQRGRRFRSAREAVDAERKARDRGEVLPSQERFDSNCITPGTEFMVKLDAQLQYFVANKISHDKLWQSCKVIYSGHQTPGEGEHKIMEYIRYSKSQPDYNPNTRHCLYGLDADLIMLGLTSHEPHFSLLREEVRFGGKKDTGRTTTPETTTFHLLHLSLMREYINYEFSELHNALPFGYDLENIIDDWVLMGFLVGNDFIPNLPNLHINKDGFPALYNTYKKVLPTMDGYLNSGGKLNLARFEKFMEKLCEYEIGQFHDNQADLKYFNSKRSKDGSAFRVNKSNVNCVVEDLQPFNFDDDDDGSEDEALEGQDLDDEDVRKTLEKLGLKQDPMFEEDDANDKGQDCTGANETVFDAEFRQHKRKYYMQKMNYKFVNQAVLYEQATEYVRALQWNLNYYYNGICSWSWFYPHHYAPYISDIKDFKDMEMKFEMCSPFLPYQQLLAVLPPLSKKLLPEAFQGLMINEDSPVKDFYPETFETDLNGKRQDWEAVVLIPFIDEKRLLDAMSRCYRNLTENEKSRNTHGPMYIYTYTPDNLGEYKCPKYFPHIGVNHASLQLLYRKEWEMNPKDIVKGLCKGAKQDLYFAGFPTLKHIKHKFHIGKENVKVFQQNSRGDNLILDILEIDKESNLVDVANQLLGNSIFVSWPHLVEAKVEAVMDHDERFSLKRDQIQTSKVESRLREEYSVSKNSILAQYHDRWGINIGVTDIIVYATPMTGRKYVPTADGRLSLEKIWSKIPQPYAYQTIVRDIAVYDPGFKQHLTPQEYFPVRSKIFMLGQPHYGSVGEVIEIDPRHKGRIRVAMTVSKEPSFDVVMQKQELLEDHYMACYHASQKLGISPQLFARITGAVFLTQASGDMDNKNKSNIGLNLKNNRRSEEVYGFTRKTKEEGERSIWLYSDKTVESVKEYMSKFPEIFEYMTSFEGQRDMLFEEDLFGAENRKERLADLNTWLKNGEFAKAERRSCGTVSLGEEVVSRLIEEVDKVSAIRARVVKMQVRPHLLYKPNPLQGSTPPDHTVSYRLFDRITNIREGFSVPLGAKGTIIGIHPADKDPDVIYDVLFDEAFPGGLALCGPLSAHRCYRLHWATMINISHGNRVTPSSVSDCNPSGYSYNHKQGYFDGRNEDNSYPQEKNRYQRQHHRSADSTGKSNELLTGLCHPSAKDTRQFSASVAQGSTYKSHHPEILSADDVRCAVHGTHYAYWSKIHQQGIHRSPGHNNIPCYAYDPIGTSQSNAYQLFIYIDVQKAMDDGIKFYKHGEKYLTCSGDKYGRVSPKYFRKVIDSETRTVIFPANQNFNQQAVPDRLSEGRRPEPVRSQAGLGRGRALMAQPPQGMQLYQNIWSQMQRFDQEEVDLRPMQSQMLCQILKIPDEAAGGSSSPQPKAANTQPQVMADSLLSISKPENTVEGSLNGSADNSHKQVEDFSQVKSQSKAGCSIMSMLNDAQNSYVQTQQKTRSQKSNSPTKSAFVPTQVIRNQTPRQLRPSLFNNVKDEQDSNSHHSQQGSNSYNQHQQQEQRLQQQHSHPQQQQTLHLSQQQQPIQQQPHQSQHPVKQNKPKRNRLAVKFNHQTVDSEKCGKSD